MFKDVGSRIGYFCYLDVPFPVRNRRGKEFWARAEGIRLRSVLSFDVSLARQSCSESRGQRFHFLRPSSHSSLDLVMSRGPDLMQSTLVVLRQGHLCYAAQVAQQATTIARCAGENGCRLPGLLPLEPHPPGDVPFAGVLVSAGLLPPQPHNPFACWARSAIDELQLGGSPHRGRHSIPARVPWHKV